MSKDCDGTVCAGRCDYATPDTPELDLALALATCIGALQAQELPHDDASKALWRWRNARGMNSWPEVNGATTAPDDVLEAEVVSG